MNRPGFVGLVILATVVVVAGTGGPLAVANATGAPTDGPTETQSVTGVNSPTEPTATLQTQEFDTTTFEIEVYENGTATWTFRYEQRLNDSDEESFESFAEEFESEETELYQSFRDQTDNLTRIGAEETDREMEARDFNRTAYVDRGGLNPTGVVEMSFTWDGFATTDDGSVVVGDVFNGIYLYPDQRIVIQAGGDLVIESISPDGAQYTASQLDAADEVTWEGEREFLDGYPRVVFADPAVSSSESDGVFSIVTDGDRSLALSVIALLFAIGIAGAILWYRFGGDRTDETIETPADADGSPPGSASGDATSDESSDSVGAPLAEEELLTDEDRVVDLIRDNGGRMKQVNIVEETGWSKSKVSMLLSDMEDDGTISKLRVGRENIISLEGFEPEATKSPFEE